MNESFKLQVLSVSAVSKSRHPIVRLALESLTMAMKIIFESLPNAKNMWMNRIH